MNLRKIKRAIWFACASFHAKTHTLVVVYENRAIMFDKAHRRALIANNQTLAKKWLTEARHADTMSEHYRKFLRTH